MIYLMLGDSLLVGMAPFIQPAFESDHPRDGAVILANTGWSTRRWLADGDVRGKVREYHPDVVVICLGTNDEGEERNPEGYEQVVDSLKADAAMLGARVIWVTSFSGPGSADRYRIIRGILGDRDTISGLELMHGVEMSGEIHPTVAGYRVLAGHLLHEVWRRAGAGGGGAAASVLGALAVGAILGGAAIWAARKWG